MLPCAQRINDTLASLGLLEKTLILFTGKWLPLPELKWAFEGGPGSVGVCVPVRCLCCV